jgi:hypothetical protein
VTNAGHEHGDGNVVLGRETFRFTAELGPSALDVRPALRLRDRDAPWPLRLVQEELRMVGDGIAIGPALLARGVGAPTTLRWFGLPA